MRRVILVVAAVLLMTGAACPSSGAVASAEGDKTWQSKIEEKLAKKVSFQFQETTLSKALDFFRRTGGMNIVLDSAAADLREKRFTLKLKDVRAESGLAWTARLMGLEYAVRDEAIFLARRDDMPVDWRGEMQARYRRMVAGGQESWMADIDAGLGRTIKVNFRNDHLGAVLEFLATRTDINIVLDQRLVDKTKPIKLEVEMSAKNILNWVTRLTGTKYVVRDEVIYVADAEGLRKLRLETGESQLSILFRRPVTFDFKDTPIRTALSQLSRYSGVKIDPRGIGPDEKLPVTVNGEGVELNQAVRMVMNATGRAFAISYRGKDILVIVSGKSRTGKPTE